VIGTPPTRDRGLGADRPERRSVARSVPPAAPIEYVRYSAYGEATVHPVADLNMDGVVTSADLQAWTDLKAGGSSASAFGLDLDFDDYYGPGEGDEDLFWESYDANLGLSGRGRVSTPGVAGRIGYAGYQWDQTAGAYHVRYRVYLPEIGRWTRRDPLGYVDGRNLYQYVASMSVARRDSTGLRYEFAPHDGTPTPIPPDPSSPEEPDLPSPLLPPEFLPPPPATPAPPPVAVPPIQPIGLLPYYPRVDPLPPSIGRMPNLKHPEEPGYDGPGFLPARWGDPFGIPCYDAIRDLRKSFAPNWSSVVDQPGDGQPCAGTLWITYQWVRTCGTFSSRISPPISYDTNVSGIMLNGKCHAIWYYPTRARQGPNIEALTPDYHWLVNIMGIGGAAIDVAACGAKTPTYEPEFRQPGIKGR
jgi:RHS repeat-associated protein